MAQAIAARLGADLPLHGRRIVLAWDAEASAFSVLDREGVSVGRIDLRAEGDAAAIDCITIAEGRRGFGIGAEATHLLAEGLSRARFRELRGWAPATQGLAVYFWLRVGFQPTGDSSTDGMWFRRPLSAASS